MKGSLSRRINLGALQSLIAGSTYGIEAHEGFSERMDISGMPFMTIPSGFHGTRTSSGTRQRKRRQKARQLRGGGK